MRDRDKSETLIIIALVVVVAAQLVTTALSLI